MTRSLQKDSPLIGFGLFPYKNKELQRIATFLEIAFPLSSAACFCEQFAIFLWQKWRHKGEPGRSEACCSCAFPLSQVKHIKRLVSGLGSAPATLPASGFFLLSHGEPEPQPPSRRSATALNTFRPAVSEPTISARASPSRSVLTLHDMKLEKPQSFSLWKKRWLILRLKDFSSSL